MKLFVKIFLWFLLAIFATIGVMTYITRTFQTEPMSSRMERSRRNQMTIFSGTATQIAAAEGEAGLRAFLTRLRDTDPPRKVDLVETNGSLWFGDSGEMAGSADVVSRALSSGVIELQSDEEKALGAAPVDFPDGRRLVLVIQWDRQAPPALFFGSTTGYLRLAGLIATAIIACILLAFYITSPIRKLREAAKRLAEGDLATRVAGKIGRRRDEISDLAREFDRMTERIESLINNQVRLNRDISHELRSPLARMNVALEIARSKANPETTPILNRIESESERLNDMIGRLLTLAKLESGSHDIESLRIDLDELVKDVAADADFEARGKGRYVNVSKADHCVVLGSENLLRSAVENVLRNAVRYTKEGTAVDVSVVRQNGKAVVTVADHGGGVPEDELKNLFRPFYRVGEDRTRSTGGIGLGLAIAERAVNAHKGAISARNENGGLVVEIKVDAVKNGNN
ncbi:MAG: HAMP domain-containing protein [Acidobacteriota bacterium]|nr:MAG: HAMP domain-containing protein [Acidobacteriota bacterium]